MRGVFLRKVRKPMLLSSNPYCCCTHTPISGSCYSIIDQNPAMILIPREATAQQHHFHSLTLQFGGNLAVLAPAAGRIRSTDVIVCVAYHVSDSECPIHPHWYILVCGWRWMHATTLYPNVYGWLQTTSIRPRCSKLSDLEKRSQSMADAFPTRPGGAWNSFAQIGAC